MKILHVISSGDPMKGGPIQGIRNYEEALLQISVRRDLVCFETQKDLDGWHFPSSINVIGLGKPKGKLQYNSAFIPWLKKNISNYNKVIINGMWTYHSYATLKVINDLKRSKKYVKVPQVFLMPHGMLDPWFQQSKTRRMKAFRNYIYWELVEKNVVNSVDGLLFTCQDELLLARETFRGYHPKKEYNIGYGIAAPPAYDENMTKRFCEKFHVAKDLPYLLFFSRVDTKKGVDILLDSYHHFLKAGQQVPDLVIAGAGLETDYGCRLLKYMEKHPLLNDKVKFTGHLSGDLKWGAIYGSEAFILPSHQENFGIAVVEALACSKPVLITNKVNIYLEIERGGGGIVNYDSVTGTKKSLAEWFKKTACEKQAMGIDARKVYENHFRIETAAERLIMALKAQ